MVESHQPRCVLLLSRCGLGGDARHRNSGLPKFRIIVIVRAHFTTAMQLATLATTQLATDPPKR